MSQTNKGGMVLPSDRATKVVKERRKQYGPAHPIYKLTAALWSEWVGCRITAKDIPHMMILLKQAREKMSPQEDNRTDIAGYANVMEMIWEVEDESSA